MTITRIERNEKQYKVTQSVFRPLFLNKSWRGKTHRYAEAQLTVTPREYSLRQSDYWAREISEADGQGISGGYKCRCHPNRSTRQVAGAATDCCKAQPYVPQYSYKRNKKLLSAHIFGGWARARHLARVHSPPKLLLHKDRTLAAFAVKTAESARLAHSNNFH
jgi:hypothetical protein